MPYITIDLDLFVLEILMGYFVLLNSNKFMENKKLTTSKLVPFCTQSRIFDCKKVRALTNKVYIVLSRSFLVLTFIFIRNIIFYGEC